MLRLRTGAVSAASLTGTNSLSTSRRGRKAALLLVIAFYLEALQVAGERLAVNQQTVPVRDPNEIERSIQAFAQDTGGGLIVLPDTFTLVHRDLIVAATAKYRLPSIYTFRLFAAAGGCRMASTQWTNTPERQCTSIGY